MVHQNEYIINERITEYGFCFKNENSINVSNLTNNELTGNLDQETLPNCTLNVVNVEQNEYPANLA